MRARPVSGTRRHSGITLSKAAQTQVVGACLCACVCAYALVDPGLTLARALHAAPALGAPPQRGAARAAYVEVETWLPLSLNNRHTHSTYSTHGASLSAGPAACGGQLVISASTHRTRVCPYARYTVRLGCPRYMFVGRDASQETKRSEKRKPAFQRPSTYMNNINNITPIPLTVVCVKGAGMVTEVMGFPWTTYAPPANVYTYIPARSCRLRYTLARINPRSAHPCTVVRVRA
jgi:hypothetical protein